jgi:ribose transport system ATP-binding protein
MPTPDSLPRPALSLVQVTKTFGDVTVLDHVSLDFLPGQVHALLGANGSGKSTTVKIMSGVYQPDGGEIALDGVAQPGFATPADATRRGVRVVHQEAPLIDTLSVAEAVALHRGFGAPAIGRVPWRRLRSRVQDLLDQWDLGIRATQMCSTLGPADRAGLALAIVMSDQLPHDSADDTSTPVRLLIVDEVTASIPEGETGAHLQRLRTVADQGVAVVMVTHRLAELEIADDISVLRASRVAYHQGGGPRRPVRELVGEMVGTANQPDPLAEREAANQPVGALWQVAPAVRGHHAVRTAQADEPVISVIDVSGTQLRGCGFTARPGEIVGFAGLRQSGIEELPRILSGGGRRTGGSITVGDVAIGPAATPAELIHAGVAGIPADRLRDGGVPNLSVDENIVLPALPSYWHRTTLRRSLVGAVIEAFDVRPARSSARFGSLSGGNQQKVLLGKWLAMRPRVLVLDDPTYGVDPGARETIFDAIVDAAANDICVLFFSTEPEQLVRVCDRVVILRNGQNAAELKGADLTIENLMTWSYQ